MTLRAILINPTLRTIEPVDLPNDSLGTLYRTLECEVVQPIQLGRTVAVWVDEEGRLHEPKPQFKIGIYTTWLVGRGLVIEEVNGKMVSLRQEAGLMELFKEIVQWA